MSADILIQYPGTDLHLGLRLSAGNKQLPKYFEVVYKGDRIGILGRPSACLRQSLMLGLVRTHAILAFAAASLISGSCLNTERFLSPCTDVAPRKIVGEPISPTIWIEDDAQAALAPAG